MPALSVVTPSVNGWTESSGHAGVDPRRPGHDDSGCAPLVAILEGHVHVPANWARAIIDEPSRHDGVVAGTVYNAATARVVDWAAFLCEYSRLLPPMAAGRTDWLTGNNTVYPRDVLETHRAAVRSGQWEDYLYRELRAAGVSLTSCPDIMVSLFVYAWGVGEAVGAAFGPGDALSRVC